MRTIACILARTASTRLPRKALLEVNGKKLIEYLIEKVKLVKNLDGIYLCTTTNPEDDALEKVAAENGIKALRGSPDSPIERMLQVAEIEKADNIVRITGDNPFTDELFMDAMISKHIEDTEIEYTRTEYLPFGVTAEVIKVSALKKLNEADYLEKDEYFMYLMFNPKVFKCQVIIPERSLQAEYFSLTVDTPTDFERARFIINNLYRNGRVFYKDILALNEKTSIPHIIMDYRAKVKLRADLTVPYYEYRELMRVRAERSKQRGVD